MSSNSSRDRWVAKLLARELKPLITADLAQWLEEDPDRRDRAARLVQLVNRDKADELKISPVDLFRVDHLPSTIITSLAREYKDSEEMAHPHLKQCSICSAFVESEAATIVIGQAFRTDLTGLSAKVPEAATDNDKWFGGGPGPRSR